METPRPGADSAASLREPIHRLEHLQRPPSDAKEKGRAVNHLFRSLQALGARRDSGIEAWDAAAYGSKTVYA
jgi:hypothetical protein